MYCKSGSPAPVAGTADSPGSHVTSDQSRSTLVVPAISLGLIAAVIAALVAAYLLLTSAPLATGPLHADALDPINVPPSGVAWFGAAYDGRTLELTGRGRAFTTGSTVAVVAHLTAPVGSGQAVVRVFRGDAQLASNALNMPGAGAGDVVAWTLALPVAGQYTIAVVDPATGVVLASGDVAAR